MKTIFLLLLTCLATGVVCDIYFHNPRGSNNRLNEKSATRANANRLFDSQNNNRGGYNVGVTTSDTQGNDETLHYNMQYFQSGNKGDSLLTLEWTNQHGCGGNEDSDPHKQNCNLVIQYMCQDVTVTDDKLRNGEKTTRQTYTKPGSLKETKAKAVQRKGQQVKDDLALHESWDWYDKCYVRERNKGLFTADQKLKADNGLGYSSAVYTRQNRNGNQYGYECPEERDYYPYWHPTPWKDIAILTGNKTFCSHYTSNSFNTKPLGECIEYEDPQTKRNRKPWSRWNNPDECKGDWVEFVNYLEKAPAYKTKTACLSKGANYKWGIPYDADDEGVPTPECLVTLDKPECIEAPWTRSNHLGNSRDGVASSYTWKLPYLPSNSDKRCVLRIRYNISTDDYDPYNTDSRHNDKKNSPSPVQNNPYVDVGGQVPLRLAINTAQFGRGFQDRSHVFLLKSRQPAGLSDTLKIHNLNVRGKRGNIVQVYPAVEYDFTPNTLEMSRNDAVHIQWTGSNTHNNGPNGGDGQTGDDGQGTGGTDRNNMVQIQDLNENFPVPFESTYLWNNANILWIYHNKKSVSKENLALAFASSGYYRCMTAAQCPEAEHKDYLAKTKNAVNNLLNNASPSFTGAVLQLKSGTYHYMCTRNNNFTNRSQKGTITVK